MLHLPRPFIGPGAGTAGAACLLALLALLAAAPAAAQSTGRILGRVVDAETGAPLAGAVVGVVDVPIRTITNDEGRYILVAVPVGTRALQFESLGHRPLTLEGVEVRAGRATEVNTELTPAAIEVTGVTVEAQREMRLIEPEVGVTHEVVLGRQLRELPVDAVAEAVELAPGVSDGHFRGGRIGQESYVVDGFELKNQLEASTQGLGLELSPTSLEEVEVVTGGFGAQYGSALSGVVSYVTRRGDPEQWRTRAALTTDHWAPDELFRGFTGLSLSAGGPLGFLGEGTTLFADVLAQGMLDADPRARGLTCLTPEDAAGELAPRIQELQADPALGPLVCPYTAGILPHQRGEKMIGFARLDRPLPGNVTLMASLLRNRFQRQLYTPEFKYNAEHHLGQRLTGTLGTVGLDWTRHREGRAWHVTARGAAMRLDRYLGALDPATFDERTDLGGFGLSNYSFLGEDFVRSPVEEQILSGQAVPGYQAPGGSTGSPFGPAAEGLFFTTGTPHIANWSRTEQVGGDLTAEYLAAQGSVIRTGVSTKFWGVEVYERVLSHLAGSAPNYARFYPATLGGFAEVNLRTEEDIRVELGVRVESFRTGLTFREDRTDFLAPEISTDWETTLMPRIAVAVPVPGTGGRTAVRFSYGRVSQPPDFRYFLDTTIGDSLRTDIRRQGNPNLGFERGTSYEVALNQLVGENVGLGVVAFRKELLNLVAGNLRFAETDVGQFSTGDFGTVQGVELTLRGRWRDVEARAGYALQEAVGVSGGALDEEVRDPDAARVEFPLPFDRRHSADAALFLGRSAGSDRAWGAVAVASVQSGYPLDRLRAAGADTSTTLPPNLPWTSTLDLRASYELGGLPGCGACRWRLTADGRNVLGRDNIIALRRDTGALAPSLRTIQTATFSAPPLEAPIPRESPRYSAQIDFDGNGLITQGEYTAARQAAALDRNDPSLFFGEARQVRLGLEVTF